MKNTLLILLLLCFAACEKDETGMSITSHYIAITASEWEYGNNKATVNYYMPEITTDVISEGTVNVFREVSSGVFKALPYSSPANSEKEFVFTYEITNQYVNFYVSFSDGSDIGTIGTFTYKVVIISGK